MFHNSILEVIGSTPMIKLQKANHGNIFAKAEFLNPGGSIKDRLAKYRLMRAQAQILVTRKGALGGIRTHNHRIRSPVRYPIAPRGPDPEK